MTANMYSLATYCSCLSQVRSLKLNKRHLLLYIAFRFVYKSGLEFTCLHCFTFVNSGSFVMRAVRVITHFATCTQKIRVTGRARVRGDFVLVL